MQGLFHQITYKVTQEPAYVRLSKEEMKKRRIGNQEKEFKLSRLAESSLFSPPIQVALPNLKREIPSAFNF